MPLPQTFAVKLLGIFVTACVVLAAAQAAAAVLALLLVCSLLYGLFAFPKELLGLIALCIIGGLIRVHPLPCLGLTALISLVALFRR